jgi:hypothetical protein
MVAKKKAAAKPTVAKFDSESVATQIAGLLGPDAQVRQRQTRYSVTLKGQPRQVLGVVESKKGVQVSCPFFTKKLEPSMTEQRNYRIIRVLNPDTADIVSRVKAALQAGGLTK